MRGWEEGRWREGELGERLSSGQKVHLLTLILRSGEFSSAFSRLAGPFFWGALSVVNDFRDQLFFKK